MIEERAIEEWADVLLDFKECCKHLFKIKTKDAQIVPLDLNPPQERLVNLILKKLDEKKPARFIILKARQEGISTVIEAFIFWLSYTNYNFKSAVVGHVTEASSNLFDMYKRYLDNLPEILKPEVSKSNEKAVKFSKLGSETKVMTAEGKEIGRSDSTQALHLTETGFYTNAKKVKTSLLQTLSADGHYFNESTGNGIGGEFYDDWQKACLPETDPEWNGLTPVFFAWFDMPSYSTPFSSLDEAEAFVAKLGEDELALMERFNLTAEQMHWRDNKIKFECSGSVDIFHQEYPSDAQEAFLTTGRPVFDAGICDSQYKAYSSLKPLRCELVATIGDAGQIISVGKRESKSGLWYFFEDVVTETGERYRYGVGTDVAEGLEQGDYSSMDVLDRKTMRYPIKFHGHVDPDVLAFEQKKLQVYLRDTAYFCTEKNNHGLTTIITADNLHVQQYYEQSFQTGLVVERGYLGWRTTNVSKPVMINDLNEAIRTSAFTDKDYRFWGECTTYVRDAKGSMGAQGKSTDPAIKCYDDRVISKALSLQCHKWMPNYYISKPIAKKPAKNINDYSDY